MNKSLSTLAVAALFAAVGCQDKASMSHTGPDSEPSYTSGHYNGAVNSTGSMVGRSDPSINPGAQSASGTPTPMTGGNSVNGGPASGSTAVGSGSGTSDQNGGSSSGTGMNR